MDRFEKAKKLWIRWRNAHESDPIIGLCLWEFEDERFKLECWNTHHKGAVIYQFWNTGGFTIFEVKPDPKINHLGNG